MRDAHHRRCAILQLLREGGRRRAQRGSGSRGPGRLRRTGSAPHSASGKPLAGQRNSALRGSRIDFHSRPNTASFDRLGRWAVFHKLAIWFSALWTLYDRWVAGAIWRRASGFGLGTISPGALGTHARPSHRILGAAAPPIWHRARYLHHLGAPARAFRPRV